MASFSNRPQLISAMGWCAFASSALIVLGIAPSQILLGVSLLLMLLTLTRPLFPPIKLPLSLFLLGTLLAVALSGNPAAGLPQIKKFFVFAMLPVVYTLVRSRDLARPRWLVCVWAACGALSALLGVGQFALKAYRAHQLHRDFYAAYMGERITGFMSHWYTFSVEEMIALLMLAAFLLFSPAARRFLWLWITLFVLMGCGVLLAETRAVWVATVVALVYLVWFWRPLVTLAIPLLLVAGFFLAPPNLRERAVSIVRPGKDDSNAFRSILTHTGVRMVEAHPFFGLGPEMPRKRFMEFLPPGTPLPLPSGSYMHLHNVYLEYAAERGIPVLLIFLWLIGKILWDFARNLRALPPAPDDRRCFLHGGIAVLLALLIEGFADVNLGDSEVLTMFWVVVSLGYLACPTTAQASAAFELPRIPQTA